MRRNQIILACLMALCALLAQAQPRKATLSRTAVPSLSRRQAPTAQGSPLRVQGLAENQRLLGYVITDSITVSGGAFGAAGTYAIGAFLPEDVLQAYQGCRIMGIRLASALSLGRTRTFVYELGGNSLTPVVEQNQRIYEGWNNVFFNGEGYEITGDKGLFFGFDYTETAEMVAAEEGALCGFGEDSDDGFYAYGDFGNGLGLYSLSGLGRLCVQLIVDVSSLPGNDLDMRMADTGFKYKKPGEDVDIMVTVANVGRDDVASYELGYQLDNGQPVAIPRDEVLNSGSQSTVIFSMTLPADIAIGAHSLAIFVSKADGKDMPEGSRNDTIVSQFGVYNNMVDRKMVYMEVYTDQASPYVPYLNKALSLLVNGQIPMALVNVHAPETTLAIDEAAYLHSLYAYTLPSFTVNRSYFPGEPYIAYDMNDYLTVVGADMTAAILGDLLYQDFLSPSFATVGLEAAFDPATRQLTVEAKGSLLPEAKAIYGDMGLTLMLTEDSVRARQLVYNELTHRTSYSSNYVHNQVLRGYLTKPTGDRLTVDGDGFTATFSGTLSEDWNPANVKVVALLTKYADAVTDDNVLDMDVVNAVSLPLSSLQTVAVQSPVSRESAPVAYYSLDGKPVSQTSLRPGLYVVRLSDGTTRKTVVR